MTSFGFAPFPGHVIPKEPPLDGRRCAKLCRRLRNLCAVVAEKPACPTLMHTDPSGAAMLECALMPSRSGAARDDIRGAMRTPESRPPA
jgi:hypothetical protein